MYDKILQTEIHSKYAMKHEPWHGNCTKQGRINTAKDKNNNNTPTRGRNFRKNGVACLWLLQYFLFNEQVHFYIIATSNKSI